MYKIADRIIEVATDPTTNIYEDGLYLNTQDGKRIEDIYYDFMKVADTKQKLMLLDKIAMAALYNGECLLQSMADIILVSMNEVSRRSRAMMQVSQNARVEECYDQDSHIESVEDIYAFFRYLVFNKHLIFHPDDSFFGMTREEGGYLLSAEEGSCYDRLMAECFEVCKDDEDEVYSIALRVFKEYHKSRK